MTRVDNIAFHDPTDTEMTPQKGILLFALTVSCIFMLLGNSFSIFIILRSENLRHHTYYWLVLNLAVLDLLNSVTVVPLNIVWEYYGNWPFSQALCDVEIFLDVCFSAIAAYSTMLLSLDKYLYITKSFLYHTYIGPKMTTGSILATWGVWITYSASAVFGGLARSTKEYKYEFKLDNCNFVLKNSYAITTFIVTFFIPLVIIIFTSSRVMCVARQHIKKIHANHRFLLMNNSGNSTPCPSINDPEQTACKQQCEGNETHLSVPNSNLHTCPSDSITLSSNLQDNSSSVMTGESEVSINTTTLPSTEHRNQLPKSSTNQSLTRSTFRAFGTITLVVLAFIIMFAPYSLALIINVACFCIQPYIFEDYLSIFYYMHSLVNPYIYMASDRRFKREIRNLMSRTKCCKFFRRNTVIPSVQITYVTNDQC